MRWQDAVLSFGGLIFIVALIPTLRAYEKPAVGTSILNMAVLAAFVVVDITLALPLAAVVNTVCAAQWGILAVQKLRR